VIGSAVAVVPLMHGDRDAPGGCAGLREFRGRSLLGWVLGALARSGQVGRVIVPVPPALAETVADALPGEGVLPVDVVPVLTNGATVRLLAALERESAEIVVLHDPLYPLSPAGLVPAVLGALADAPDAVGVVPLGPVTDTLKRVGRDDVVTGTVDREGYRTVHVPQAYRTAAVRALLSGAGPDVLCEWGPHVLPELVRRVGGRLVTVPAPAESVRVDGDDGLVLAEALLDGPRRGGPGAGSILIGTDPDRH
jgi:2-C-methyl-D-erythritol 4-phosphate cytidylyltransferase